MQAISGHPSEKTARTSGRPRSEQARAAILSNAYELLLRQPVGLINVVQIAKAAGVSTATVYRWWSNKEELLLEAFLEQLDRLVTDPPSGSPLQRLEQRHARAGSLFSGKHGRVVARLLAAIQDDQSLRNEFLERVQLPQSKEDFGLVREAISAGELPVNTQIQYFLDMIYSPLVCRLVLKTEPITREFIEHTFQYAILGAHAMYRQKGSRIKRTRRSATST